MSKKTAPFGNRAEIYHYSFALDDGITIVINPKEAGFEPIGPETPKFRRFRKAMLVYGLLTELDSGYTEESELDSYITGLQTIYEYNKKVAELAEARQGGTSESPSDSSRP